MNPTGWGMISSSTHAIRLRSSNVSPNLEGNLSRYTRQLLASGCIEGRKVNNSFNFVLLSSPAFLVRIDNTKSMRREGGGRLPFSSHPDTSLSFLPSLISYFNHQTRAFLTISLSIATRQSHVEQLSERGEEITEVEIPITISHWIHEISNSYFNIMLSKNMEGNFRTAWARQKFTYLEHVQVKHGDQLTSLDKLIRRTNHRNRATKEHRNQKSYEQ